MALFLGLSVASNFVVTNMLLEASKDLSLNAGGVLASKKSPNTSEPSPYRMRRRQHRNCCWR